MKIGDVQLTSLGGERGKADPTNTSVQIWDGNKCVNIGGIKSLKYEISVNDLGVLTIEVYPRAVRTLTELKDLVITQYEPS